MPPSLRKRRPVPADDEESEEDARPRQRRNRNDSPAEPEEHETADEMDTDIQTGQSADDQLVKKFVRYVISCEYSRTLIRREGIKERVLGSQGRLFKRTFDLAQMQLRQVWGMELRELPVRERMTLQEKRQAMKLNSQPKVGSGTYCLSSTLPEAYRAATIISPSKTPSVDDEATYIAFYTTVVSMIMLSNGELSEQKLRRCLTRFNADQNVASEPTEVMLKKMEKHGYVIKKIDKPPVGYDGDHIITWHVGPRAKQEVGLDGVMGMVREVFGDSDPELEKKLCASLNIKERSARRGEEEDGDANTSRRQSPGED